MSLHAALYCRLSIDDGENTESQSIQSQKKYLSDFAKKNGYLIRGFYIDDGFSGTNFNRPEFNRMLNDIEKGLIEVVIVKDLSRLGRNYLKTGYYLEEYFPSKNVKFIAINDNYDSSTDDNEFAPFKNIMNEYYAKDISKKIKTTHHMNQKKGMIPTGKLPLYGYLYDQNRNRVVDPYASEVVKRIFNEFIKGYPTRTIATNLTKDKIYNPGYYMYLKYKYNPTKYHSCSEKEKYDWDPGRVNKILSSPEYNGDLVVKKSHTLSFKNKKKIKNSEEEQLIFKKRFEPIVTDEMMEEVKRIKSLNERGRSNPEDNRYKGLLFCKCCGQPLNFRAYVKENRFAYVCNTKGCERKVFVSETIVDEVVKTELTELLGIYNRNKKMIKTYIENYLELHTKNVRGKSSNEAEIKALTERNLKLDMLIGKLFETHSAGHLPQETFDRMLENYTNEQKQNQLSINKLQNKVEPKVNPLDLQKNINIFFDKLFKIDFNERLNHDVLATFIERIDIDKVRRKGTFEVKYKIINQFVEEFINATLRK